jgi:hypothetical protein
MAARFSLSKMGIRHRGAATLAVAAATLFGLAGTVQTAEVLHHEGEQLRPTGKGWGELDPRALRSRGGGGFGNGIYYHGGPVMLGMPNIYYIWYGNWDNSPCITNPSSAVCILTDLAKNFSATSNSSGSSYLKINSTYYSGTTTNSVSGQVNYAGSVTDSYSHGTSLSDAAIQSIVTSALGTVDKVGGDPNGVYFVLTSEDVNEISGFCTQYCAWHTSAMINGKDIKFAFVGNPDRCPSACSAQSTSPNNNPGADGMANLIGHELSEALSDPDLNAWYDQRGNENGDKCAWNFGATSTLANGSQYNVTLGSRHYLLQRIWANAKGGYCAISYP